LRQPLQNRVDPFGGVHAVTARGALMGNRGGCLHDDRRQLGRRRWASKRWIACVLAFKERHRTVMAPGRYTELFFLDEATALAAGHRPCFECRRQDAEAFAAAWARACNLAQRPRADAMDIRLHTERGLSKGVTAPAPRVRPATLPHGTMVALRQQGAAPAAWLVSNGMLRQWSFGGYTNALPIAAIDAADLITAPAVVAVLQAGYRAGLHPSAG
jgi:hypothetical protein